MVDDKQLLNAICKTADMGKESLRQLRKLAAEADIEEQEAIAKRLDNEERQHNMQLFMTDSYIQPLANAASKLDIRPQTATVIDITNIIQRNSDTQDQ